MMKNFTKVGILILAILFSFSVKAEQYLDLTAVGGEIVMNHPDVEAEKDKDQAERWITVNNFEAINTKDGKCNGVPGTFSMLTERTIEFHLEKCDKMVINANIATGRGVDVTINDGDPIRVDGTGSCEDFEIFPDNPEAPMVIKVEGIHNRNKAYISLFSFYYEVKAPKIEKFSVEGLEADIDEAAKTITLELPFGTDIDAIEPVVVIGGTAESYLPAGAQDFSQGSVTYTASNDDESIEYTVTITAADAPDENKSISWLTINGDLTTIDEDSGEITLELPSYKGPLAEWTVEFNINSEVAISSFNSGDDFDFAANPTLEIVVTAQDASTKTYTVTPTISTKKNVAILSANGQAESYDDKLLSALEDYYITFLKAEASAPDNIIEFYENYDLIILHANVGGTNATGLASANMVGVKPMINLKAYFYNDGRWSWSDAGPQNAPAGSSSVEVEPALQDHPIFDNVVFNENTLTFYDGLTESNGNAIQYARDLDLLSMNSYTIGVFGESGIQMHEIQENIAAKFLMIGLSMENNNYTFFNENAINIFKNSAAYLLDDEAKYDYSSSSVKIDNNELNKVYYSKGVIYNPETIDVEIYDISGNKVASGNSATINISYLQGGVYIVKSDSSTIKIVK